MPQSEEPGIGRILPFPVPPTRQQPRNAAANPADTTSSTSDDLDRLLDIKPVASISTPLTHVRPVSIGLSSGAFYPHVPTELVPFAARDLGVTAIEVMLQTAGEYDPGFIRELKANAEQAGVTINSVHTMLNLHPLLNPYGRRRAEGAAMFLRGVEAAATLGAKSLVWHGAHRREVASTEDWDRFLGITRELARICAESGVILAIENVAAGALSLVRHVVSFATRTVDLIESGQIGFTFDPFQAAEAGANPFMMLAAMGNRVVNVHLSDYSEQHPERRHLMPGDGDLPWSALIRAIAGTGYSGPLILEGPVGKNPEAMERARKTLNPLLRSVFTETVTTHPGAYPGQVPDGVRKGIELFNERRFYEQHEEIEAEWHAERGEIRRLYQGILQIGIGFHHALNGNYAGAITKLKDGITKTAEFTPQALGIDTADLVRASEICLRQIEELGPSRIDQFNADLIPSITVQD